MTIFISGAISGAGTFGAPDYNIGFNGFSIIFSHVQCIVYPCFLHR